MRPKKIRAQKVMHTRKGWKHADGVKRLRIIMASVAAAAIVFIAAAGVVIWMMLQGPLQSSQDTTQSDSAQTSAIILPVYDDSFNLVLVNKNRQLKSDFSAQLTEFEGVQIEERILPALEKAKAKGLKIPVVYNTGGYEKTEIIKMLDGIVDIWLPDHKYRSSELSAKYSRAKDYPEKAAAALEQMVQQTGVSVFDKRGMMKKGVIVRHLVLPGCISDSKDVLEYLWDHFGNKIYVSIMSQYTPLPHVTAWPELNRQVTWDEYHEVVDYARFLGMSQVYIQEGECAKDSFIPAFDCEGI